MNYQKGKYLYVHIIELNENSCFSKIFPCNAEMASDFNLNGRRFYKMRVS